MMKNSVRLCLTELVPPADYQAAVGDGHLPEPFVSGDANVQQNL